MHETLTRHQKKCGLQWYSDKLPAGLNWHILSGITGTIKPEPVAQIEPYYPMGNDKRIKNCKFFKNTSRIAPVCRIYPPEEDRQELRLAGLAKIIFLRFEFASAKLLSYLYVQLNET